MLARERARFVQISLTGVTPHAVLNGAKPFAGYRDVPAVREVAAHRQRHPHHGVARFTTGEVHGQVRRRARIRLHVRVLDPEQARRPLDRERLELVDDLLALVVAAARVALGVLVREDAAHRLEHRARDVVLRRDQADRRRLPLDLVRDQSRHLGIGHGELRVGSHQHAHKHLLFV